MTILACAALLIGIFIYIFYPQRKTEEQTQKTRLEYLRERKETIYENLRDLNFEYRAGKYPEEDYLAQRAAMENEAAQILSEIEFLEDAYACGLNSFTPRCITSERDSMKFQTYVLPLRLRANIAGFVSAADSCSCLAARHTASAAPISGTVTNQTTKKPAVGDTVALMRLGWSLSARPPPTPTVISRWMPLTAIQCTCCASLTIRLLFQSVPAGTQTVECGCLRCRRKSGKVFPLKPMWRGLKPALTV